MSVQPAANIYALGFGTRPENVEIPHIDTRDPSSSDVNYPLGKQWINTSTDSIFILTSFSVSIGVMSANWKRFVTI